MKNNTPIRVRIAPSPTGNLHIGTARTALFNYLFAQKHGGEFIIRIEDTDIVRSKPEFEKDILDGLAWLGLRHTELYKQSERTEIYKTYLNTLINDGYAYESQEEVAEEGQRASVIRFKNPNKTVTFTDMIRGDITFDTTDLGDFVIAKSLTEPLYHLAVVVDDHEMNISHVIRGEDHISNTPRQILLQEAIGAIKPLYAHLPLILSKERKKLSKRDGAQSIQEFVTAGYLKDAMVNFIAFLGWHPEDNRELFTLEELFEVFDIARIQKGGAIFDTDKLAWFNKEHLKQIPDTEFVQIIKEITGETITHPVFIQIIKEHITLLKDVRDLLSSNGEFAHLLSNEVQISDTSKVIWKDTTKEQTNEYIQDAISLLKTVPEGNFEANTIKSTLWDYATEKGRGAVLWPIRYLLSGLDKSPDPFTIMEIIGKEKSLIRLENGIKKL